MIKIDKILIPIDFDFHTNQPLNFDDANIAALKYGCEFASQFKAEVHILHVIQTAVTIEVCVHEAEQSQRKKLEDLIFPPQYSQLTIKREIRKGRPFVEIIKYAQTENMDLIIIGTHGHKALSHILIGSETENTVRKAPCPVLVVRHPEHEFVML